MTTKFVDKGQTMGGYRCLTLQHGDERVLAGKRGEIWEVGPQAFKAVVALKNGENEKIFSFGIKDLKRALLRIEAPVDPREQAQYANNPNLRLKAGA